LTTQRFMHFASKVMPVLIIGIILLTSQAPLQAARVGEKEKLQTEQFQRQYSDHFANVAEALRPSVVSIDARFTRSIRDANGEVRTVYSEGNYGTGFIFDREGHVVTDIRSVLLYPSSFISPLSPRQSSTKTPDYIKVTLYNGQSFEAEFVGIDGSTGLAVIRMNRVNPDDLQPVVFSEAKNTQVGEPVMILDYNYYNKNLLGGSFGVVAALRGQYPALEESENEFIMINFPKMGGNDGGIIIDVYGQVLAMVSSYTPYDETAELHYGIPVDIISKICNSIISVGVYQRPWYGFTLLELNDTLKLQENIEFDEGMYIAYIEPESPAEKAGLEKGDVLFKWDGEVVKDVSVIINSFEKEKIGTEIEIEYFKRDFNVWDTMFTKYTLAIEETTEEDELARARERARKYL
jgi:S1-C subfamily serine protease